MAIAPVFQLSKEIPGVGVDYDYLIGLAQAQAAVADGYAIECVAYVASDTPGPNMVELKRYVQNGFHYFTSSPGDEVSTWTYCPPATKTYVLPITQTAPSGAVGLSGYSKVFSNGQYGHFFTANLATNPHPSGYTPFTPNNTGWVMAPTRVEFSVTYNGNGNPDGSGVTVTGGNLTGEKVRLNGQEYTMTAADAYVAFGTGNWVAFNKADTGNWHISDIATTSNSDVQFTKVTFAEDKRIALIDNDLDDTSTDEGYEYTLSLFDVTNDKTITFDPKIVNRGSASSGPTG